MYNAYGLSQAELDKLISIADEFRQNVIDTFKAKGLREFDENLTDYEEYDREMLDMMAAFNDASDRFSHAVIQTSYMAWSISGLVRTFGEDAILDLVPEQAKTEEAIELFKKVAEYGLANLCQAAKERDEQPDNTGEGPDNNAQNNRPSPN